MMETNTQTPIFAGNPMFSHVCFLETSENAQVRALGSARIRAWRLSRAWGARWVASRALEYAATIGAIIGFCVDGYPLVI